MALFFTRTVTFGIGKGVELAKLGPLAKFHAQLVDLVAWQVPKKHQGTHHRSHQSLIFQLQWWFWYLAGLVHKATIVPFLHLAVPMDYYLPLDCCTNSFHIQSIYKCVC